MQERLLFILQDESLVKLAKDSEALGQKYNYLFDMTIVNHNIEETITNLESSLAKLQNSSQWVPASWIY